MKLAAVHPYLRYAASVAVTVVCGFRTTRMDAGLSVAVRMTATAGRTLDLVLPTLWNGITLQCKAGSTVCKIPSTMIDMMDFSCTATRRARTHTAPTCDN